MGTPLTRTVDARHMNVDLGNALAAEASPGISRENLERLDEQVAVAHERIEQGIADREHGYAALALPETVDTDAIEAAVEPFADSEAVLTVGIGGSALGAATIADALDSDVEAYFLDNVDPEQVTALLADLPLGSTTVNVVSRSGTTAETLANFLVVRDAMESAGVDWTERTFVTTGESGPLRELADRHDLPSLPVPDGVPGRFSALSTVGLACAAIQGHDLEEYIWAFEYLREHGLASSTLGVGSILRPHKTSEVRTIIQGLREAIPGKYDLHGFGISKTVLEDLATYRALDSADTTSWHAKAVHARVTDPEWADRVPAWVRTLQAYIGYHNQLADLAAEHDVKSTGKQEPPRVVTLGSFTTETTRHHGVEDPLIECICGNLLDPNRDLDDNSMGCRFCEQRLLELWDRKFQED